MAPITVICGHASGHIESTNVTSIAVLTREIKQQLRFDLPSNTAYRFYDGSNMIIHLLNDNILGSDANPFSQQVANLTIFVIDYDREFDEVSKAIEATGLSSMNEFDPQSIEVSDEHDINARILDENPVAIDPNHENGVFTGRLEPDESREIVYGEINQEILDNQSIEQTLSVKDLTVPTNTKRSRSPSTGVEQSSVEERKTALAKKTRTQSDLRKDFLSGKVHQIQVKRNESSLWFSCDIKPLPKPCYMTDKFPIKGGGNKGAIVYVQAAKEDRSSKCRALPQIRIPEKYFQGLDTVSRYLFIFVVDEQTTNNSVVWLLHPDRGFLPEIFNRKTSKENPIYFDLKNIKLESNKDFELKVRMETIRDKTNEKPVELFSKCATEIVNFQRRTDEIIMTRLLCVICENGAFSKESICVSNYIAIKQQRLPAT